MSRAGQGNGREVKRGKWRERGRGGGGFRPAADPVPHVWEGAVVHDSVVVRSVAVGGSSLDGSCFCADCKA